MFTKIMCSHISGIDAILVEVEIDVASAGLPSFNIVGLAEGAVRESKERVRSALKNLGYNIFAKPVTVNLAPADIKKEGSYFDLPIAIGLLAAHEPDKFNTESTVILGELSLDGTIRGVSGVLCISAWAASAGINRIIVPQENMEEASLVSGINVYAFKHISQVIGFLKDEFEYIKPSLDIKPDEKYALPDFSDVKGQFAAKRAAEIAAAGMHNILMIGAPGSGKTMIARRLPSILPPMSINEALLTTKIHSVAGLLKQRNSLVNTRPFIAPHHTASDIAIIGGGAKAMPGHVSIATNGILFLDEMLEFNRSVLEVLRQPLEDGFVTIARAGKTVTYPADFMLVAACNPCPCGYYGDNKRECTCSPGAVEKYRSRLSGPLLDRIDLHINMLGVDYSDLQSDSVEESSDRISQRVIKAQNIQNERFLGSNINFNSQMSEKEIQQYCKIDEKGSKIIENAMKKFALSARAYNKILKCSRTIADLSESNEIKFEHIAEALQYRVLDK